MLLGCLGCGKRPKVSSQATCLDFIEVAIHSDRHRCGAAASDPAFEPIEAEFVKQPVITVPTIVLHGDSDGVSPPSVIGAPRPRFLPARIRETPEAVVQAVRKLDS
jgi:pimeloyl-ACP methyl ester carboxylesterase